VSTLAAQSRTSISAGAGPRTAVTAAALAGALASAAGIANWFLLANLSHAQIDRAPLTIVEDLITAVAYIVLAVSLPALAGGSRLPHWALCIAGAACASIAIAAWTFGSVIANLANTLSDAQFDALGRPSLLLQLFYAPTAITGLIGFIAVAVAVTGCHRAMSRGACVLLVLAGLAALLPDFPPVGLLAGVALAGTVRSAQPRPTTEPAND
jgi:hypothetical protein